MDGSSLPLDLSQTASPCANSSLREDSTSANSREDCGHKPPDPNTPLDLTRPESSFMISQILKPVTEQKLDQKPLPKYTPTVQQRPVSAHASFMRHFITESDPNPFQLTVSTRERDSMVQEKSEKASGTCPDSGRPLRNTESIHDDVDKATCSVISTGTTEVSCGPENIKHLMVPMVGKETLEQKQSAINYFCKDQESENKDSVGKLIGTEILRNESRTCVLQDPEQVEANMGENLASNTSNQQSQLLFSAVQETWKSVGSNDCIQGYASDSKSVAETPPNICLDKIRKCNPKSEVTTETPESHLSKVAHDIDKISWCDRDGDSKSAMEIGLDIVETKVVQEEKEHGKAEQEKMPFDCEGNGVNTGQKVDVNQIAKIVAEKDLQSTEDGVQGSPESGFEVQGSLQSEMPFQNYNLPVEESSKITDKCVPNTSNITIVEATSSMTDKHDAKEGIHQEVAEMDSECISGNTESPSTLVTDLCSSNDTSSEFQEREAPGESQNENNKTIKEVEAVGEEGSVSVVDGRSTPKPRKRRASIGSAAEQEEEDPELQKVTAEKLFEYQWPQERGGEWFMLQEQVSEFLGVLSFKRKHPDMQRRPVEMQERIFLQGKGVVTETQCDLGLTALKSEEMCELMMKDYNEKYQDYAEVLQERERKKMKESQKNCQMPKLEKSKMDFFMKKAIKSAAEYNANFLRERREERRAYLDLQTQEVHFPLGKMKKLHPECTKLGAYPVSLIPGQYQDYHKVYEPQQLKYFPINTAVYDSPRALKNIYVDPNEASESEEEDGTNGSSSGEDSGSSGSSSSDADSEHESQKHQEDESRKQVSSLTPVPTPTSKCTTRRKRGKVVVPLCNVCNGTSEKNKLGEAEELVKCSECGKHGHPSCIELTNEMIPIIHTYKWQCMECKTCVECTDPYDEDKMMFCDHCDRGYHTFCVGLRSIPTGRWECPSCRPDQPPPKKRGRTR